MGQQSALKQLEPFHCSYSTCSIRSTQLFEHRICLSLRVDSPQQVERADPTNAPTMTFGAAALSTSALACSLLFCSVCSSSAIVLDLLLSIHTLEKLICDTF